MIKSEFTTYQFYSQFLLTGVIFLMLLLFYVLFFGKNPIPVFSALGIWCVITTAFLPIYIVAQMRLNYKTITIDTEAKTISFTAFLFRTTRTYPLAYFDAYVETKVDDQYGTNKCLYLVKDRKLKYKISGRYYANLDELQKGLSSLKYMGFINYSGVLSLRIACNQTVL